MSAPIRRILVGTDFSERAAVAFERAVELAEAHAAELVLVHALDRGDWIGSGRASAHPELHRRLFEAALDALGQACARARGRVPCHAELVEEPLHRALAALLVSHPAELLVIGAQGASAWQDALLGSTADRVLRLHCLPVLLVRRPGRPYARVALATDFSRASEQAARFAHRLLPDAVHLLLHASDPPFASTLAFAGLGEDALEEYRTDAARDALRMLEAFADRLGAAGQRAVPALREGRASRVLSAFVEEASIDLAVVGASGRSGVERGLLGSVSRHASAGLPCDVLVVPDRSDAGDAAQG